MEEGRCILCGESGGHLVGCDPDDRAVIEVAWARSKVLGGRMADKKDKIIVNQASELTTLRTALREAVELLSQLYRWPCQGMQLDEEKEIEDQAQAFLSRPEIKKLLGEGE